MHCPGGNATDPIWRVLASSDGISSGTSLKPQYSNPNPNPLANQLVYWLPYSSHTTHHPSQTPCLPWISYHIYQPLRSGRIWHKVVLPCPFPMAINITPRAPPWISYATQKLMFDSCKMVDKQSKAFHTFLWHFFQVQNRILLHIVLLKCQTAFLKFTSCDNQALVGCIPIPAIAVHLNLKS